jgi:hypothetical protein
MAARAKFAGFIFLVLLVGRWSLVIGFGRVTDRNVPGPFMSCRPEAGSVSEEHGSMLEMRMPLHFPPELVAAETDIPQHVVVEEVESCARGSAPAPGHQAR